LFYLSQHEPAKLGDENKQHEGEQKQFENFACSILLLRHDAFQVT